jgi:hypothetical protein
VRQVYERAPTEAELAAGSFVFTDSTPDTVKGAGAYFSANTGEGLAQSNYGPALVHGLCSFNDSLFGVTVDGVHSIVINLLGADALSGGNGLRFTRGLVTETYEAGAAESFPGVFKVFTGGTPAQNTASTIDSLCRAINSRTNGFLYAFPLDTDGTNPGGFIARARDVSQEPFSVEAIYDAAPFVPRMNATLAIVSAFRVAGVVTVNFGGDHGLSVDDQVDLLNNYGVPSDATLFPPGVKDISAVTAPNQIQYLEAGTDGNNAGSFSYKTVGFDVVSTSGTAQNAYAWTKQGEPDHWPLANLAVVGGATDTLWWGASLDRFLFLGSTAGLWRLQGNARSGFTLMDAGVWDSTVSFLGRRNVAVIDGQGYAVAREGLVTWSEGQKPDAVDIPIQDEIRALVAAIPDLVAELGFMVADQSNHRLYVCLPQEASDTAATRCHVLSTRTGAWTRLTDTFPGFEEGFVAGFSPNAGTGVAHFITPEASALQGYVLSTRATYTDADYQGPDGEAIPAKVTYLPMVAGEPGRFKDWTWTRVFTKDPNADEDTTKLQVCFATEMLPAETCKLLPDVDPVYTGWEPVADPVRGIAWKTIVDMFHQRGKGLTVAVGRSVAQQPLRLMGLEVKHRAYGSGQ